MTNSSELTVVEVLPNPGFGGVETQVLDLIGLAGLTIQWHVISSSEMMVSAARQAGAKSSTLSRLDLFDDRRPARQALNRVKAFVRAMRAIWKRPNSIIHIHATRLSALVVALVARMRRPVVITVHGLAPLANPRFLRILSLLARAKVPAIAVSEEVASLLKGKIPNLEVKIVRNGIRTDESLELGTTEVSQNRNKNILFVGRLDAEYVRVAELLVEYTHLLQNHNRSVHLTIVGWGTCGETLAQRALQVNNSTGRQVIHMEGFLTPREVKARMRTSTLVVGCGRVAMEGLGLGLPVLVATGDTFGGRVTAENIDLLAQSNFTGRNMSKLSEYNLFRALEEILSSEAESACPPRIANQLRDKVDARKMVNDTTHFLQYIYQREAGPR